MLRFSLFVCLPIAIGTNSYILIGVNLSTSFLLRHENPLLAYYVESSTYRLPPDILEIS
jgi:hypothetical protein